MNLEEAVTCHMQWKVKLRNAAAQGATVDAAMIGKDDGCPFGLWLHGEARTKYGALPIYRQCVEAHAQFHREASKVAHMVNRKEAAHVEAALSPHSPFCEASNAAVLAITRLKKEISTAHAA